MLGQTVEEEVKTEAIKAAMLGSHSKRKVKPQKQRCSGRHSKVDVHARTDGQKTAAPRKSRRRFVALAELKLKEGHQ